MFYADFFGERLCPRRPFFGCDVGDSTRLRRRATGLALRELFCNRGGAMISSVTSLVTRNKLASSASLS